MCEIQCTLFREKEFPASCVYTAWYFLLSFEIVIVSQSWLSANLGFGSLSVWQCVCVAVCLCYRKFQPFVPAGLWPTSWLQVCSLSSEWLTQKCSIHIICWKCDLINITLFTSRRVKRVIYFRRGGLAIVMSPHFAIKPTLGIMSTTKEATQIK